MRDTLGLLELLLIERDIVVACYVLERSQKVVLDVLLPLLLLDNDRPFEVQVVGFFKDVEKWRVRPTINANLLELVPEVILDRLLFEAAALENDVVFALQHKAVDNEVLTFEQIGLLKETDHFLCVDIIITLLNVHRHEVQVGLAHLLPFLLELLILLHDVVVVENGKAELVLVHLAFQVF